MVIIETPPMLRMPDARVVGRIADAVILVTRAGHTTREATLAANHRFAEDRTRVLGTILNHLDGWCTHPWAVGQMHAYKIASITILAIGPNGGPWGKAALWRHARLASVPHQKREYHLV
jgi:Mrp family chromosome partitioning ATPase